MSLRAVQLADAFWEVVASADDVSRAVQEFVRFVEHRGMRGQWPSIVRAIERQSLRRAREMLAVVRTAHEVSGGVRRDIEGDLEGYEVQFDVRPELIGGIEVQTFDRRISRTVQSILSSLRHSISS